MLNFGGVPPTQFSMEKEGLGWDLPHNMYINPRGDSHVEGDVSDTLTAIPVLFVPFCIYIYSLAAGTIFPSQEIMFKLIIPQ